MKNMPLSRLYVRMPLKKGILFILPILIFLFLVAGCAGMKERKEKATAMQDMGRSLVAQGDSREGLAWLMKAAENDPDNPDIEHDLALVYQEYRGV